MTEAAAELSTLNAKLTLIRGTQTLGSEYELNSEETVLGGEGADLEFENDSTLSPMHCQLTIRDGGLWVEDLNSHNGTYLRVHRASRLHDGDYFLVGEQVLRFELPAASAPEPVANDHGELFCGTPRQPCRFTVHQILAGGRPGLSIPVQRRSISIGRDGADLEFPWDPYMSGKHCKVTEKDGQHYLLDLDSRNGTFVRLPPRVPVALQPGDFFFFGRQLVRVDPN